MFPFPKYAGPKTITVINGMMCDHCLWLHLYSNTKCPMEQNQSHLMCIGVQYIVKYT